MDINPLLLIDMAQGWLPLTCTKLRRHHGEDQRSCAATSNGSVDGSFVFYIHNNVRKAHYGGPPAISHGLSGYEMAQLDKITQKTGMYPAPPGPTPRLTAGNQRVGASIEAPGCLFQWLYPIHAGSLTRGDRAHWKKL